MARSSGRATRYSAAEQLGLRQVARPADSASRMPQQLAGIVPLVERLGRVDALVALQPDQRRVEHGGQRLGRLGLADAGLAFEQQRLRQPHGAEQRRRQP